MTITEGMLKINMRDTGAALSLFGRCRHYHDGVAAGLARVALGAGRALRTGRALRARVALGALRTGAARCALRTALTLGAGRAGNGSRRGWDIHDRRFFASAQAEHRNERNK